MSSEFLDKLEHIRGAVAHHMYEEESDRFLDLKQISATNQARLTARYMEEFDRYVDSADESQLEVGTSRQNALEGDTLKPGLVR